MQLTDDYFASKSSIQVTTKNVHNIAVDPLDENYFASAGSTNDPSVTVWDKRWISQNGSGTGTGGAVFDFQPAVDNTTTATIWSLRYSGQQRGRLAMCSSRGELKVIDMVEGRNSLLHDMEYLPVNSHGGQPWIHNSYVSQTRSVERPLDEHPEAGLNTKLIAFDWIPANPQAVEQDVLALRPNRKIDILRVPRTVSQACVSARYDMSMAFEDISILEPKAPVEPASAQPYKQARTAEDFGPSDYEGESMHSDAQDEKLACTVDSPQLASMLACPTLQRERCRRGYLWNCARNTELVSGNWQLERLWEIINRFRQQANRDGMVAERQNLDLSYIGIAAICAEKIGTNPNRKLSFRTGKMEDAVVDLAASRGLPPYEGIRTQCPHTRQLCLEMCGWKFRQDDLEQECRDLSNRGLHYQAVVQAVLHQCKPVALNLLRSLIRAKTVPNSGLGALLASDKINEEQREMCMWMAADTDDPALKALLAYLTTGDWRDVMKTNYLHLGYRVALGLKYLDDNELYGFIQSETARAIKNGDLEGILLTGLGEQSMNLLQTYITKSNDLQTAVLAAAYTNPRFIDDVRWEMWKETYFMQMQSWRAFTERSQFMVQHSQMAGTEDRRNSSDSPTGQISLRCNHCQLSLAKYDNKRGSGGSRSRSGGGGGGADLTKNAATTTTTTTTTTGGGTTTTSSLPASSRNSAIASASAGITCPKCGRHMPRCGICKMWLGTPDPHRSSSSSNSRGGAAKENEVAKLNEEVMAKFLTFCVNCEHGFHAHHAKRWFAKHDTCPVPDCRCLCTVR